MLIGSEITYRDALSILYVVHVKGNHADRDKVLLKKSCHGITLTVEKARFAQALRNSTRAMSLTGHCPKGATRHHQMTGRVRVFATANTWRTQRPHGVSGFGTESQ